MNTTEFKSIMNSVSPEMVAAYEWNNLEGVTLESVCAEYDSVKGNPNEKLRKWHNFFNLHIVITFFVFLSFSFFANTVSCAIATIVCLLPVLYFAFFKKEQLDKGCEILTKCNTIFDSFKKAVDGLNPTKEVIAEYSTTSIRKVFVNLAASIIDAEIRFDKARRLKHRPTEHIVNRANLLLSRQENLEKSRRIAKDNFGIIFKSVDLFADAQKQIVSLDGQGSK
jgi:hypothetical protein